MKTLFNVARLRSAWQYRHEPESARILADAYWLLLLAAAGVLFFVSVLYGAWAFTEAVVPDVQDTHTATGGVPFMRAEILSVLAEFDARAERYRELKRTPSVIPSPL